MRKFTKGLLLTFVATAMSLGAYAQDQDQNSDGKYFRVINAGYQADKDFQTGVVYISEPTTAQPQKTTNEAVTLPGTVMWINAVPITSIPDEIGKYEDVTENDYEVLNLRSQGVDANEAVYGPMVTLLREGFTVGLEDLNNQNKWGFSEEEQEELIDQMFDLMKMFLEPTDVNGEEAWYLKSTTPNTQPLVDALKEKNIEPDLDGMAATVWAWKKLTQTALAYFKSHGNQQLYEQWYWYVYNEDRIHIGHTYYLIGGRVETDLASYQRFNKGPKKGEYISFANNNKYYQFIDENTGQTALPEIEVANNFKITDAKTGEKVAGNFAKWYLREVVTPEEAVGDKEYDYFAVEGSVLGGNYDGDNKKEQHYYTTIYTDFPMEIVPNNVDGGKVKAYGIASEPALLDGFEFNGEPVVGYVKVTEIEGTIPPRTPVVIECVNSDRESNTLLPTGTPKATKGESFLKGIFFEASFDVKDNTDEETFTYHYMPLEEGETYARKLVRVFNRSKNNTDNPVGFYKYKGSSIKPNKAFMTLNESMAAANILILDAETFDALGINEVKTTTKENATIYDIQGRVVTNPTKGVYIVNGKKMVIK